MTKKCKKSKKSKLEESLFSEFKLYGLPLPLRQSPLDLSRKWTLDFFWEPNIAVEVQGGIFMGGKFGKKGHSNGARIEEDHEKLNFAIARGISVFQFGPKALYRYKRTNEPSAALQFIWRLFRGQAPIPLKVLDPVVCEASSTEEKTLFSGAA